MLKLLTVLLFIGAVITAYGEISPPSENDDIGDEANQSLTNDNPSGSLGIRPTARGLVKYGNKLFSMDPVIKLNWYGAWHYCKRNGMELATVGSKEEHEFLKKQISEQRINDSCWISLNNLEYGTKTAFFWAATGELTRFTRWAKGEPSNKRGRERCVEMRRNKSYEWNDESCDTKNQFICQKIDQ